MNISMKQKYTHRHTEQTFGYQGGWAGEGKDWVFGTDANYRRWINNQVLLCSTGNYIQ